MILWCSFCSHWNQGLAPILLSLTWFCTYFLPMTHMIGTYFTLNNINYYHWFTLTDINGWHLIFLHLCQLLGLFFYFHWYQGWHLYFHWSPDRTFLLTFTYTNGAYFTPNYSREGTFFYPTNNNILGLFHPIYKYNWH